MTASKPPSVLIDGLRTVFYPLVRLMLAKGITYTYLADLLKEVFVEVAEREFRLRGKAQTDSRISLLTGVHRKDVRRLRDERAPRGQQIPDSVSLGAQLVAAWTGLPQYRNADGSLIALPRLASKGGELSFEGLVTGVSKDIRSRAVLDEWLRLGVVMLDDQDRVVLKTDAFVPQEGFEEKAFYFAHNLHDHAAAATHNLLGEVPPFFERSVHYDALSPEAIEQLRELAAKSGMESLLAVNRRSMAIEADRVKSTEYVESKSPEQRFTYGIYFYSAPMSQPAPVDGAAGHNDD